MKYIFILLLITPSTLVADVPVDKAAHLGISWAINHGVYEVCKKVTDGKHKTTCMVTAIVTTAAVGISKEIYDGKNNSSSEHLKDMGANGLGILGSSIVIGINF